MNPPSTASISKTATHMNGQNDPIVALYDASTPAPWWRRKYDRQYAEHKNDVPDKDDQSSQNGKREPEIQKNISQYDDERRQKDDFNQYLPALFIKFHESENSEPMERRLNRAPPFDTLFLSIPKV